MGLMYAACMSGIAVVLVMSHFAIIRLALRMFEYTPPLNADESAPDVRAARLRIATSDGITLEGCHYRQFDTPSRGLILFCHELGADKWSAMTYCEGLYRAGFEILAFDFRNHGQSDYVSDYEPIHWLTNCELDDVQAALRYIEQHPRLSALPLGLYGISRGGGAALAASAECRRVHCVCSDSAYSTRSMTRLYSRRWLTLFVPAWVARLVPAWHINLMIFVSGWISQIRRGCRYISFERLLPKLSGRPVFLISGKRDTYVLPEIAKSLYESIGGDEVTLWIVPDAKHNQARAVATEHYDERLVEFFSQMSPELLSVPAQVREITKD